MSDKRIYLLRDEKVFTSLITMAAPAILGLLVQGVYNMVDTMFVSWLGPTATGATQVVFVITTSLSAIGLMFGIGVSTYISRLLGQNEQEQAERAFSIVFFGAIVVGLCVTLLFFIFIDPLLRLVGATNSLLEMSRDYSHYLIFGFPFMILNMLMNNSLRGEGSAKYSMIGMGSGAILNIILDPVFIFVLNLGIKGAAIATSISQIATTIILLSYYLNGKSLLRFKFRFKLIDKKIWKEVLNVGIPSFLTQLLMSISVSFINNQAGNFGGDNAIAAIGIVTKLIYISIFVFFGLGMGLQPLAGYSYGAKNQKRLLKSLYYAMLLSILLGIFFNLVIYFFGSNIISIFKPTEEVFNYAIFYLNIYMISITTMSIQFNVIYFLQAIGKGFISLLFSVSRQGILLIPMLLILPKYYGINGVFYAQALSDIIIFIFTLIVLFLIVKKFKKKM
ncbi:MAG: MATE family efflux transporter [Pleomorphochaeta sp.]